MKSSVYSLQSIEGAATAVLDRRFGSSFLQSISDRRFRSSLLQSIEGGFRSDRRWTDKEGATNTVVHRPSGGAKFTGRPSKAGWRFRYRKSTFRQLLHLSITNGWRFRYRKSTFRQLLHLSITNGQ